jgi:hypothetical protein
MSDDKTCQDDLDRQVEERRQKYEQTQKIEDDRRLQEYLIEFRHQRRLSEIEKETKEANEKNEEACRKDIQGYYASAYYSN